jgi:hypothetical protein
LQLKPNCDLKLENKKYDIILEGLGEEDKKSIRLEGVNKDLCKENKLSTNIGDNKGGEKFEYSLLEFPEEIQPGQEFKTKVQLVNNDDSDYDIGIWSYVYRGSKCYSGERTENKQELNLKKGTSQVVGLSNIIKDAETGDYNLKVFINKNNQKTNKEITESIKVLGSTEDSSSVFNKPSKITNLAEYNLINQLLCTDSMHYKQQIYESSNERIKKMIPYFMIFLTTLLSIVLIWKR